MCEFCGVVLTRLHDLTRHHASEKCKDFQPLSTLVQIQPGEELATAGQSTSGQIQPGEELATAGQSTSGQIQPGEEELATAGQSTSGQIQPGEEELATAGQSTSGQIQPGEEELATAGQSTSGQIQPGEKELATAGQSTSGQIQPGEELATAGQSTSGQIQPGEEELATAGQSTSVQIQPGEEELATAGQSTSGQIQPGEEELAPAGQSTSVQIQHGEEELAPAGQSTSVQTQPGEEELAITSFTAIAPEGVDVGSPQFYQFISSAVEDATDDFDVSSPELAETRELQLKPAVVRNGTNLFPGLEIPRDELSFRQVLEGFPLSRKINVCFYSLQEVEDDFDLMDLLTHNENQTLQADYHPMNVIDLDIEGHLNKMSHKFSLPDLVRDISYGHRMKAALPSFLRHQYDFTAGISNYLLLTEAGAQTNWHQDFTGTSVFYVVVKGRKDFYILEKNGLNQNLFDKWKRSDFKTSTFFGFHHQVTVRHVALKRGDCLFLPSEWIHFVYTPEESIAFGCNFIMEKHFYGSALAFEKEIKDGFKHQFSFPHFAPLVVIHLYRVWSYRYCSDPNSKVALRKMLDIINRLSETSHPWNEFLYYYSESLTDLHWADIEKWLQH